MWVSLSSRTCPCSQALSRLKTLPSPSPTLVSLLPLVSSCLLDTSPRMFLNNSNPTNLKWNSLPLLAPHPAAPPELIILVSPPTQKPGDIRDSSLPFRCTLDPTSRSQLVMKAGRFCVLKNSEIHHLFFSPTATACHHLFPGLLGSSPYGPPWLISHLLLV